MTSPADNPLTVSIGSTLELARAIEDFIRRNPSILGGADLYLLDWGSPSHRAGVLAATLVALRDSKGRRAAETLIILSPPGRDREAIKTQAREGFVEALKSLAPNVDLEAAARWFDASARVEIAPDRRSASVVALAKDLPARTVMIVQEAAEYRDDTVAPFIPEGATGALLPADIWAPQLHALAETVVQVIAGSEIHLAFDTHRPIPVRENLLELLKSIEGCGVFGGASEAGVDAILAEHVERWDGWIRDGHLGRALRELDALSVIDDEERSFVRIQLLHRADRRPEALAEVRALLDADRQPSSKDRVRLARICADANSLLLAREVLAPAIDRLESLSDLEVALGVAEDVGDAALQDAAAQRLEALFPASPGLIERQRRQLLSQGRYARLAKAFPQDAAHGAYRLLTEGVAAAGDQAPDYIGLIAAAPDANTAEWLRYLGFDDAMRRGLILHAFALVRDEARLAAFESFRARKLIRALEAIFLRPVAKGQFAAPEADIQTSLVSLIRCLARRPQDAALRALVAELLKPAVAGASGFHLAILALVHIAAGPINLVARNEPSGGSARWLAEHKPFVRGLFEWLGSEAPIVMGRLPAPEALITESADAFVSGAVRCISAAPLDVADDVETLHTWIAVGAAVAPYTVDPDYDLVLIRLGATRLASSGFPQAGRDLAEQAMLN